MDAHKLQVKLFATTHDVELEAFVPVFHGWIKNATVEGELLLDVASYAHVPQGPGVALIGHGSDWFLDEEKGRVGLLYSRKREAPAPEARLADAFRKALDAAIRLEAEPALAGKLKFGAGEILFRVNDRLLAPSNDASFAAVRPELEAICGKLFAGAPFELTRVSTGRELLTIKIVSGAKADLATLHARI
jgi:hypothetical protein